MAVLDQHTGKRRSPSNALGKARYEARFGRAAVTPEIAKASVRTQPQTQASEPVQTPDGAAWPTGSRYMVWTWETNRHGIGCNSLPARGRRR